MSNNPYPNTNALFRMKKSELQALAKIHNIRGRSTSTKAVLFQKLHKISQKFGNNVDKELRERRIVKPTQQIINQHSIKSVIGLTGEDLVADGQLNYVNNNIVDLASVALRELFKDNRVILANLQYVFVFVNDSEKVITIDDVRHTKAENASIITKNFKRIDILPYIPTDDSAAIVFFLGYRILYATMNSMKLSADTIRDLKAFSPTCNRKYHELTTASTSDSKLCIYETFLDVMDMHGLRYARRNEKNEQKINDLLANEGDDIMKSVKNGELVNSLELLTRKYKTIVYIVYYGTKLQKDGDMSLFSEAPIMIDNGITTLMTKENINLAINKKCFLYEKNKHVAPFIFTYNCENIEKKKREINYALRPNPIKGKVKKIANILGYDIEAYTDLSNKCIAYCVCLFGKLDGQDIRESFYGVDSIKKFVNYLSNISTKVNDKKARPQGEIPNIHIYGFNSSRFDNIFIYQELHNLDPNCNFVFAGNSIKYMKYENIKFYDISLFYKNGDLRKTTEAFGLEKEKGVFPYGFPKEDNLCYVGQIPELKYWNSEEDYDEYRNKNGDLFDMEAYTKKYCMLDSELVYEMAVIHVDNCIGEISGKKYNVVECQTAAKLSVAIFEQVFQEAPLYQSPDKIIEHERESYKGGRTEVFKKKFIRDTKNLLGYDINSAHPHSMTSLMPYKYINSIRYKDYDIPEEEITDYYCYYAKSEYVGQDKYIIPNLLIRNKGHIIACNNSDYSWHWGAELKEAIRNGFKITVRGADMYEGKTIFKSFVEHFYNERLKNKNSNIALATFYKNVLNSIYGKFGQRQFNKSELFDSVNHFYNKYPMDTVSFVDMVEIGDKLLISFSSNNNEFKGIGTLVRFSSYIAALTRCKLSQAMRDVGHENVYYCDTDSIFTTKELSNNFIDNNELGKWKLENEIMEASFLAPKSYFYVNIAGKINKKTKGMKDGLLSNEDYKAIQSGEEGVSKQFKMFIRSLECIKIIDATRTAQCVYNKRIWEENDSIPFKNIEDWSIANN